MKGWAPSRAGDAAENGPSYSEQCWDLGSKGGRFWPHRSLEEGTCPLADFLKSMVILDIDKYVGSSISQAKWHSFWHALKYFLQIHILIESCFQKQLLFLLLLHPLLVPEASLHCSSCLFWPIIFFFWSVKTFKYLHAFIFIALSCLTCLIFTYKMEVLVV